jgi:heavy metal efflux system protein
MLDRIIHFSIKNKLIIGLFTLALIAWGSYSLSRLPVDAVPDITNNQVQVITLSPSLAAQEVERLITFPIEQTMATIPDIEEVRSISRFGLSVITIVFEDKVDIYWARQQVNERLGEARNSIPPGIGDPEMAPVSSGLGEVYQYLIHAKPGYEKQYTITELRTIQDWIVRRQLLGTPGVAEVNSFGGYLKQYEIALDPARLRSFDLSINEVFTALERNNQNTGGAYIDKQPNAYFIRSEGLIEGLDDIRQIVVKNANNGIPIFIRDVATVEFGHANRYGALTRNADGEAVGAIVMMLKGENANQVVENVKERMEQIRKTLPEGVEIEVFLDRSEFVGRAIGTVTKNLVEGALIVIFVLVLFLGNLRAGLIVASVIPLSMLFAISLMNLFGVTGNLMSLGAIDFGLIVDGAVIIVEATMHHLGLSKISRLTQEQMDQEVYESASKIRTSAAFGEIIILIVYLPILALSGIEGKMFRPMAQTVSFAILGAFILSLTYVPMMSALLLSKKISHKRTISDRMMAFFGKIYQPLVLGALKKKALVVITALALFALSLFIFSRMGGEFIPTLEEGDFALETRLLTGSSLSETVEKVSKASEILMKQFPEVEEVVGKIGAAEIPTDPMPMEASDITIMLKDKDEWTSADSREELASKMAEALEAIPGVNFGVSQPIQLRFNELISGVRQDVGIKIFGEDLSQLTRLSEQIGRIVGTVKGATDLYLEKVTGLPQIVINIDRSQIAKYGLDVETINRAVNTAFAGQSAGLVYEGEKRFDLIVRLSGENRQNIENVRGLFITAADGDQVPLEQLARVEFQQGPNQIQREDAKRRIIVGFNVRGRDIESVVEEIQEKINEQIKLPVGYFITYGGQFENLKEAQQRLSIAVPIALALIFLLLFFTFDSVSQSLLIFTAIPMSAIGGVLALWFRGMPFSISAGVGFIALFGVAVLNGIVLIAEFNRLKSEGELDIRERILKGTQARLRPVLMTATVASLGFLPMALSNTAGAEVQKPLATVVIGGLVSATLLTLIVLPVLYSYLEKWINRKGNSPNNAAYPSRLDNQSPDVNPGYLSLLLLLALSLAPFSSKGQQATSQRTFTIKEAIQTAAENNGSLKAASYGIAAGKALKGTAFDLGTTDVELVYGQYNSLNKDNNFTISQSFTLPMAYRSQARLIAANIRSRELQREILRNEITRDIRSAYYGLAYARANLKRLLAQDTIYKRFAEAAALRYKTGETNQLEQVTAQSQLVELQSQILAAEADIRIYQRKLQTLLNVAEPVNISDTGLIKLPLVLDSTLLVQNPRLSYLEQQREINRRAVTVGQANLLPTFSIGYFNQSLIGTQTINGVERSFDRSDRFQGVQAGISIPLWFRPGAARIKSAKLAGQAVESTYQYALVQLRAEYASALERVKQAQASLSFYETAGLPQASLLVSQAEKSYRAGEIDYLEYTQLLTRAFTIQSNYLKILNDYNQAVIELEFILGNPNL